jgi:hypothetical protein
MISNTLHRKVEQHQPYSNRGCSAALEREAVPTPHVNLTVLLFLHICDKSWMKKEPDFDYDKRNIYVVICDTDIS